MERCPQVPEGVRGWCSAGWPRTAPLEPAMIAAANIRVDSAIMIPLGSGPPMIARG